MAPESLVQRTLDGRAEVPLVAFAATPFVRVNENSIIAAGYVVAGYTTRAIRISRSGHLLHAKGTAKAKDRKPFLRSRFPPHSRRQRTGLSPTSHPRQLLD